MFTSVGQWFIPNRNQGQAIAPPLPLTCSWVFNKERKCGLGNRCKAHDAVNAMRHFAPKGKSVLNANDCNFLWRNAERWVIDLQAGNLVADVLEDTFGEKHFPSCFALKKGCKSTAWAAPAEIVKWPHITMFESAEELVRAPLSSVDKAFVWRDKKLILRGAILGDGVHKHKHATSVSMA